MSDTHYYRPKPENLCVGGSALSSGDSGANVKENAFDGNDTTYWLSSTNVFTDSVPTMADYTSGDVTVSTDITDSSYPVWKLFDDDATTKMQDTGHKGANRYARVDFGSGNSEVVRGYSIQANSTYPDYCPTAYKLQGSNNGSTWVDLDTQTGLAWTALQKRTHAVSNTTAYRYYQWYWTAVGTTGDEAIAVEAELLTLATTYIGYDFGVGSTAVVKGLTIKQGDADKAVSSIIIQASSNGTDWSTISTETIVADTTSQVIYISNSNVYRYWRIIGNSITTDGDWEVSKLEFTGTPANMTLISVVDTATTVPESIQMVVKIEPIDSITINTDVKGYVSRDSGTTWTQASFGEGSEYATGKYVYSSLADVSTQPSGTSVKWKVTTHNNKSLKLRDVRLSYLEEIW